MTPKDLCRIRIGLAIPQRDLAVKFGVSQPTYHNWENEYSASSRLSVKDVYLFLKQHPNAEESNVQYLIRLLRLLSKSA